jgi:hypothetical protein
VTCIHAATDSLIFIVIYRFRRVGSPAKVEISCKIDRFSILTLVLALGAEACFSRNSWIFSTGAGTIAAIIDGLTQRLLE